VEDHEETIKEIKGELDAIEKRRSKWQYAWVNGMFSSDESKNDMEFKNRMNEEDEKEKMLQKELDSLTPNETPSFDHNVIEMWTDLKLNWAVMEKETKKQFILIALQSMVVDKI
jgi:site-specific DNA recombinase